MLVRSPVPSRQRKEPNSPPASVRHIRYEVQPGLGHQESKTPWRHEGWETGWGSHEPECLVNLRKVAWGVEECQDRWYVAPFKMRLWAPAEGVSSWDPPAVTDSVHKVKAEDRPVQPFSGSETARRPEVMMVINLSTNYLHAVEYWDSGAPIGDKVRRMSELLVRAMGSCLIGARGRPSRPRKIGFADKEVANKIHVSLAQINIAVVHETVSRRELASMTKVFSYYARCKNGTQSPYHDVGSLSAISDWQTVKQLFISAQQFPTLKILPLRQGHDVLGVCHINQHSAEVRYFVVLGLFQPENEAASYTYGVVMYDSLEDVLQHCPSKPKDQRSGSLGVGVGMLLYDYRCVPFDDIESCEEMGLVVDGDRPQLHPIPVEYNLSPFEDPRPWVEGRFLFDYFANISDQDMLWFEIFFKVINEKGNYKLVNYVPSRVRLNLSSGDGYTVLVKGSKSTLASHADSMESMLAHKPRKLKSAPRQHRPTQPGSDPRGIHYAQGPHSRRSSTNSADGMRPVLLGQQFARKLRAGAINSRLKVGDADPTPKLELINSNMLARPKKLEEALARITRACTRSGKSDEVVAKVRHDKSLIVPTQLAEEKTRLMNLENAAAMLVDHHVSDQMLRELQKMEESQHFQPKLKVISHSGVRHAKPVVRAEEELDSKFVFPKSAEPAPDDELEAAGAE